MNLAADGRLCVVRAGVTGLAEAGWPVAYLGGGATTAPVKRYHSRKRNAPDGSS